MDIGAPIMGLQGSSGEVLAGDPIPAAPGQADANTLNFSGEGSTAIIKDGDANLWDGIEQEAETIYIQEEAPEGKAVEEETVPTGPTTSI